MKLPFTREYNENPIVLYSAYISDVSEKLKLSGNYVSYALIIDEDSSSQFPLVTVDYIKSKMPSAIILLDERCDCVKAKKLLDKAGLRWNYVSDFNDEKVADKKVNCVLDSLFIDCVGDVYPCSRIPCSRMASDDVKLAITNVSNIDAVQQYLNFAYYDCACKRGRLSVQRSPVEIENLSIEFGGSCNADCVYCYQKHVKKGGKFDYNGLKNFVYALNVKRITVAGGEVLAQRQTKDCINEIKRNTSAKFSLKTNGFSRDIDECVKTYDEITVSLNSFSKQSTQLIMGNGVNIDVIKTFCEKVSKKVKLNVKFLLSPLSLGDLPDFIEWVITLGANEVSITKAMVFGNDTPFDYSGSALYGLNKAYWDEIICRINKRLDFIIKNNYERFLQCRFRFGHGVEKIFNLSQTNKEVLNYEDD